jgi:aldehyde dehydrogenase
METTVEVSNLVARPQFKERYENFIGGEWVAPVKGEYFQTLHQ